MTDNPYETPNSEIGADDDGGKQKPGIVLIIFTALIVIVNLFFGFILASVEMGGNTSGIVGYIIGQVFVAPIFVVGIFQISKRFRNSRSRTKIFFWMSIIILISNFGNLAGLATQT